MYGTYKPVFLHDTLWSTVIKVEQGGGKTATEQSCRLGPGEFAVVNTVLMENSRYNDSVIRSG
ncbi:hypothetical protein [Desulfobulbus oligotrophicus]|jgi:hypothetical protein|uniref:Uncharacterized protein n=1 Tax=Desulfobulbus oligotrophicus TaxID=1909699 RepID=A0A7T5VAP9_9BACT|nr:hypothetical protein [Desulfobulbus oligotrophicus]MDY0391644.1 hypothetical protein [Desulfobulbus oligotrophicus]QQG64410.1 hypothetical protein HP555_00315 [Desulfobulbus oligotrophicus]